MKLLTAELCEKLPRLYSQEHVADPIVYAKFFTPDSNWTWFVTEGEAVEFWDEDDTDFRFFGFVVGFEKEWGYFLLSELEAARGPLGLAIERDLNFRARPVSEVVRT